MESEVDILVRNLDENDVPKGKGIAELTLWGRVSKVLDENSTLKSQLAELEKIADEMSEDMQGCESCFEQKSLSALTAYRQKWQGEK